MKYTNFLNILKVKQRCNFHGSDQIRSGNLDYYCNNNIFVIVKKLDKVFVGQHKPPAFFDT